MKLSSKIKLLFILCKLRIQFLIQRNHKKYKNKSRRNLRTRFRRRRQIAKLKAKYNFKCSECKTSDDLTIDHIVPISKGGSGEIENLQILCSKCNHKKGNRYII